MFVKWYSTSGHDVGPLHYTILSLALSPGKSYCFKGFYEHIGSRTAVLFSNTLYLLQIPSDRELCVDVQFKREYYVGAVQAVPINVYDYYKPGKPLKSFHGGLMVSAFDSGSIGRVLVLVEGFPGKDNLLSQCLFLPRCING